MIITPLISAETWAGAIGWASGNQTWSGIRPAFAPIPTSAASAIPTCTPDPDATALGSPIAPSCASSRIATHVPAREMRQRDVEDHRAARRLVRTGDQDHRRRDERHRLPGDEERQRVARDEDEHLHRDEQRRECPDRAPFSGRRQVADRVRERGGPDHAEHAEEQAGEGVDPHAGRERARERLAGARVVAERPESPHGQQQAARSLHGEPDREREARDREQPPGADRGDAGHHERGEGHDSASSRSIDC